MKIRGFWIYWPQARFGRLALTVLIAVLLLMLTALAYAPYLPRLIAEGYPPPIWPASGAFAEIHGVAAPAPLPVQPGAGQRRLTAKLEKLFRSSGGKALLAEHGGQLALEHYAPGISSDTRFNSFSIAKSLVGAMVFKALAEGKLASLDMSIGDILPSYGDDAFRAVTVRALLEMRGGVLFESDDPLPKTHPKDLEAMWFNPLGPMARLHAQGLTAIAGELTADPKLVSTFRYQNVNTAILGALLEALYHRPLDVLLAEEIWRPAGAGTANWRRYRAGGAVSAYCCIYARAQDWLRIGRFLLDNGKPGEPFLPEPLWRRLLAMDVPEQTLRKGRYGAQIRHDILDRPGEPVQGRFTYMLGQGGQVLYLIPDHDMLVLRFGDRMQLLHSTLYETVRSIGPLVRPQLRGHATSQN